MSRADVRRPLSTERLSLIPTEPSHAPGLTDAILASLEELRPWMAWAAYASLEQTRAFASEAADRWATSTGWTFTIVHQGERVGTVGLDRFEPTLERAELGYWIKSDLAGRGLMREACRAVVDFGFREVRLHRIELHTSPDNHASVRVAEGLGFKREGLGRDMARNAYGFYDCAIYGLLRDDPRP